MRKNGFTLIELLAVIIILSVIALIAVPIILGIIRDARKESRKRSIELYASAVQNGIVAHQLRTGNKIAPGLYESSELDYVEYDGDVVCDTIELYKDGKLYIKDCTVNGVAVEYAYGIEQTPEPKSFAEDDWNTIAKNVKAGNLSKYNVGDTREIALDGLPNSDPASKGLYTIRIANTSTPSECSKDGYSQTACGFVIEFEDIIRTHKMNATSTNAGGYSGSSLYTYLQNDIYNALPKRLKNVIIPTLVVSGQGSTSGETNSTTTDNIYLLSAREVYGTTAYDNKSTLSRQLDYYQVLGVTSSNFSNAIKKHNGTVKVWWLRSAYSSTSNQFLTVYSSGILSSNTADTANGVSIAFRIG